MHRAHEVAMTLLSADDRAALETRWREPQRFYHGMRHLEECLARFAEVRALAKDPDVVEAALWLHDAIYDARRDDNETRSAALARAMLEARGVDADRIARVEAIILATRHTGPSADPDTQLACDIDLAVLGADDARFDQYEREVRAEYAWVPMPIFRVKRAEILMRFLASPRIFQTEWFHARLDGPARDNLSRSLEALRGP
jgi:predicted metal-dependent HD superfamily phosphohydrolase